MSDHVIECLRAELAALREQLAERDAEIAALKGHAEAIAHDYFMSWAGDLTLDEFNEYPVIAAYRAAYPEEDA